MNDLQILQFGLRVFQGAWSAVSPTVARIGEHDEEIHDLWTKIDEGIGDLDRLVRKRVRDVKKS